LYSSEKRMPSLAFFDLESGIDNYLAFEDEY